MKKGMIYIHGKDGSPREAEHYRPLLTAYDVIGLDYKASTPWEAKEEFPALFDGICGQYRSVSVIANSIGAYFTMQALHDRRIEKALFISPVANMEQLITDMLTGAQITEQELCERKQIDTAFGETLSWDYLCYVRENPVVWNIPTAILYGEKDCLTSLETVSAFADQIGAALSVMKEGEHWFHTDEQMRFLDRWIVRNV